MAWLKIIGAVIVALSVLWFAHPSIAGIPAWLDSLGFLKWLDKLDPVNKWAATLVTLFAVGVALAQERIKSVFLQSRLSVRVEPGVSIPLTAGIPAHHYRLGITAENSVTADYVEVYVAQVWANGKKVGWWSPSALGWADGDKPYREFLSGGTTRLCNIISLLAPGKEFKAVLNLGLEPLLRPRPAEFDFQAQSLAMIMIAVTPNGGLTVLFPGRYVIELDVSAKNARPVKYFVEVKFDGSWSSDPNRASISLKVVDSHK